MLGCVFASFLFASSVADEDGLDRCYRASLQKKRRKKTEICAPAHPDIHSRHLKRASFLLSLFLRCVRHSEHRAHMLGGITKQESKVEDRKEEGIGPPFCFPLGEPFSLFSPFRLSASMHTSSVLLPPTHYIHICIHACTCTYRDATVCVLLFHILVCNRVGACVSFYERD